MLVVRGTKKLRDRLKGAKPATAGETSTTALGDWFGNALFWRPQVALLVNRRTLLPVFLELAPAATLLHRAPAAIESVLRRHGVDEAFLDAEREAMREVLIAPTDDRSTVGVMNEFTALGERLWKDRIGDLEVLSLHLSQMIVKPLYQSAGSPDRELALVAGNRGQTRNVVPVPSSATVFQLEITLLDTAPPIWRRVLLDGASTLDRVHHAIQGAMGWGDRHLHEFEIAGTRYAVPDPDDWGEPAQDERRTPLDAVAGEGSTLRYTYDLGDGWEHRIVVEKVLPREAGTTVPSCIDGRRACPPEDCGGAQGYRELLTSLADPTHPEHDDRRARLGGGFEPDAFDPAEQSRHLRA